MSTSWESSGRPPASTTIAFLSSKLEASFASSAPASAIVSRFRANADGFAAVIVTRLPPGTAGFASAGFASAGFAAAGLGSAGFAGGAPGFGPGGAAPGAGGAANATATHRPKETVTDNAKPNRILVMIRPSFEVGNITNVPRRARQRARN